MKKAFLPLFLAVFFIWGCDSGRTSKDNVTSYNYDDYALNYAFLKTDKYSDGETYYLSLYLSSDESPSPFGSSYSFYTATHTLVLNIVSDSPYITAGTYTFSTDNYTPYHFNYLQYYFLALNQFGFASSGTLEVEVDGSEYTYDLTFKASSFVGSNDTGETVTIKSHYNGTIITD